MNISKDLREVIRNAADEICYTYDVRTPRGKDYSNPPAVITRIIEQRISDYLSRRLEKRGKES